MSTLQGIASGRSGGETATEQDCRVWPRHDCAMPGTCAPLAARADDGPAWEGSVLDISVGGLRLVLSRRFEAGTVLSLEVDPRASGCPQRLLVRVVRVESAPGQKWLLGCALLSRLSQEKLQTLLGGGGPDPVAVTPEQPAAPDNSVLQDVTFAPTLRQGGVGKIRARRLHLGVGWPPAAGSVLTLGLDGNQKDAVRVRLRVVECARRGEGWVVRYELLERPSAAVLHLLRRRGR